MPVVDTVNGPVRFDVRSGLTPTVEDAYLHGQCAALAVALNRATGWPMVAICAPELLEYGPVDRLGIHSLTAWPSGVLAESFDHAVVLSPQGAVDVRGPRSLRNLVLERSGTEAPLLDPDEQYCPPGCVCPDDCCLADAGLVCVYVTSTELLHAACVGDWPRPNLTAAETAARQVLTRYGIAHDRTVRRARPPKPGVSRRPGISR